MDTENPGETPKSPEASFRLVEVEPDPAFEYVWKRAKGPEVEGTWETTPTVHVCPNAPLRKSRIEYAMRFWERLGYPMNGPIMNSDIRPCWNRDEHMYGTIVIDLRGQDFEEDKLALTKTYRRVDNGNIVAARIDFQAFAGTKERVLEHEFGHAFGWKHYHKLYHLMHPNHPNGGWDTTGLRLRED